MAVDHVLVDTGGTISRGDWTCLSGCDTDTTTWPVVWDYSSGDYSLPASKLSNGAFASPFLEVHSALSMFIVVAAAPTSMVMACDLDECSATSRMGLRACSLGINARASTLDKSTSPPRMVLVEDFGDRRAALAYLEFSELEPYDPTSGTTPKSCSFSDGYDATVGVMNAIHAGSSGEIYYTYEYPQDSNHYGLYMRFANSNSGLHVYQASGALVAAVVYREAQNDILWTMRDQGSDVFAMYTNTPGSFTTRSQKHTLSNPLWRKIVADKRNSREAWLEGSTPALKRSHAQSELYSPAYTMSLAHDCAGFSCSSGNYKKNCDFAGATGTAEGCKACDASCPMCEVGGTDCCRPLFYYDASTGCEPCTRCGYTTSACSATADAVCGPCDDSCDACTGPSAADCTVCASGYWDAGTAAGGALSCVLIPKAVAGSPLIVRVDASTSEFDVEITLADGGIVGGPVYAVAMPSADPAPTEADVVAAADVLASGSVDGGDVMSTSETVTLTGALADGKTSHTLYIAFPSVPGALVMAWTLGEAGERDAGAACVVDLHCGGSGLVCNNGVCGPPAPAPAILDVTVAPASGSTASCVDSSIAVADLVVISDGTTADIITVASADDDVRNFRVQTVSGTPTLVMSAGDGSPATLAVTPSAITDDGTAATFAAFDVNVTCAHRAASCAGSCGDFEATLRLRLQGFSAASFDATADDGSGVTVGAALAQEVAYELGVDAASAEYVSAADDDANGASVEIGLHLPAAIAGSGIRRLEAAVDASGAASHPTAVLRKSLFPAAGRLVRRALGSCCLGVAEYRLAAPTTSPSLWSAAGGTLTQNSRDVTLTVTVANAPSDGAAVTVLYYTLDDTTPVVGTSDSVTFSAGANSGALVLPTASDDGQLVVIRMVATTDSAGWADSVEAITKVTYRDHARAGPMAV